jgi:hypothetical protein
MRIRRLTVRNPAPPIAASIPVTICQSRFVPVFASSPVEVDVGVFGAGGSGAATVIVKVAFDEPTEFVAEITYDWAAAAVVGLPVKAPVLVSKLSPLPAAGVIA